MSLSSVLLHLPLWANWTNTSSILSTFLAIFLIFAAKHSIRGLVTLASLMAMKKGRAWIKPIEERWLDAQKIAFTWPLFIGSCTSTAAMLYWGREPWSQILDGIRDEPSSTTILLIVLGIVISMQFLQAIRFKNLFGSAGLAGAIPAGILACGTFSIGILLGPIALALCLLYLYDLLTPLSLSSLKPR